MLREKSRGATFPFDFHYQSPLGKIGLAVAIGIAYFMAAELGLTLRANTGTSVFWPAAGIMVGALIVWGPEARWPVAAAVVVATAISNLTIGRNPWLAGAFGVVNAGQALLTAELIERWFGRSFKLGDVPQVLGFLIASAIGASVGALGATIAVGLIQSTASPFIVWRYWFASCLLGIVTVAPLLVGISEAVRQLPPRRELIDGAVGILMLAVLSAFVISLPQGPWSTAIPVALVFPVLLWVIVRCRPVFATTAAFVVASAIVWSTTFGVGHFGDPSVPLADRILAAQTIVLVGALLTLVLVALFAERRRSELVLERSRHRLQLALDGAELGAFSADLATGCFECDARTAQIHGHNVQPTTIRESRRFVLPQDRVRIDAALAAARRADGVWNAEYRVAHPESSRHAGETRWAAVEGSIVRDGEGTAVGLLGVTRDITDRKQTERALAERDLQMALAGKSARVGTYAYDVDSDLMQVSEGYVAVHGLPEGIKQTTRTEWKARTHAEDLPRLEAEREQAFRERLGEYAIEYRIVRSNDVRWIESRSFISYDGEGRPERVVGVNIDITERKRTEERLQRTERKLRELLEALPAAIYETDVAGHITYCNQSAVDLWGVAPTLGKDRWSDLAKFLHADGTPMALEDCPTEIALKQGRIVRDREAIIERKDGRRVSIAPYPTPLRDEAGTMVGIVNMTVDISERKRAELALAERDAQLALAGKAARVGSFVVDYATGRIQTSPGYAAIHGLAERTEEYPRAEWRASVHPDDLPRVEALRTQAIDGRVSEHLMEYRIIRKGGETRWIESRGLVSYNDDGRPMRLVGVHIDITERKLAELSRADRNKQLELAGKVALVGGFAVDVDATLKDFASNRMQVSPGFSAIYGLREETAEISVGDWRSQVHPDDLPQFLEHRQQVFAQLLSEHHAEFRIVRPCGTIRWIEARSYIEYDQADRAKRMVGVNIDVTERKRAEEARTILNAELDHRVKNALATVSAVVSHTREGNRSVNDFIAALEGRLRSMATAHELLSAHRWQGISLTELIRRELAPYSTRNNTEIDGSGILLKPEAGQALAMVLHELATNAAKHGALSTKEGRVSIRWGRHLNGRPRSGLVLEWQEIGGPPIVAPGASSYGTSTIRDLIPYELGGAVDLVLAPEGARCRLELPADWLSQ